MSAIHVSAEEMASVYRTVYCVYAACALLIYDWLLYLGEEVRFVWSWDAGLTGTSLVYASSRYMLLIQTFLAMLTNYPMSDLSCRAVGWTQTATGIVGAIAFSAFSALRAYALSNRNMALAAVIVLLTLPPTVIRIVQGVYSDFENLPSPFNCSVSNSLPPELNLSITLITRASQLAAELLVIIITWWYTYRSYRLQRSGVKVGKSISSLLVYNGSIYFLFLASLYIIDIIFSTAAVPDNVLDADALLELFYDPITSILVCHFMLSLRRFDSSSTAAATFSGAESQSRAEHANSASVLHFAAQESDTLPPFIASFAQPIHVDSFWSENGSETDSRVSVGDSDGSGWREGGEGVEGKTQGAGKLGPVP